MTGDRIVQFVRDDLTFDVVDRGPIDGDVIVLLHGFPQRASSWNAVAEILIAEGYRVLAFDQRGYSPGARPARVAAYTTNELSADVVALADIVGTPVHLVGHDWGATVAWATALKHPEKVVTLTALSLGHPSAYLGSLIGSDQLRRSYYLNIFLIPKFAEHLLTGDGWGKRFIFRWGMTDQMYATYQREIVDYGALTGGLNWYRALPRSIREPRGNVGVPTTMVWGTNDIALGRCQAERTERYVNAPYELVVLDGASHWIPDERPSDVAQAVLARIRAV